MHTFRKINDERYEVGYWLERSWQCLCVADRAFDAVCMVHFLNGGSVFKQDQIFEVLEQ